MRLIKTIPEMGGGRIKENDGGLNSAMIYCTNFCKCHNVPLSTEIIIKTLKIDYNSTL
jgi:hypothetical protein